MGPYEDESYLVDEMDPCTRSGVPAGSENKEISLFELNL